VPLGCNPNKNFAARQGKNAEKQYVSQIKQYVSRIFVLNVIYIYQPLGSGGVFKFLLHKRRYIFLMLSPFQVKLGADFFYSFSFIRFTGGKSA